MSYRQYNKEIRDSYYRHGQDMATRILNVCNRVLSGECESAACRKENVKVLWLRNFLRKDIGIEEETHPRLNPRIKEYDWSCWQDKFLTELTGEEYYAPDDFDEIFEECITKACTEREQRILKMRYQEEKTLKEVGKEFNICADRIRQIQAKALRKLRHPKYRLFLVYGQDYKEAVMEHRSAQAEYDQARLACMEECERKRKEAIVARRDATEELQKQIKDLPNMKIEKIPDIEEISINEMDLSVRSYNCLMKHWVYNENGRIYFDPIDTVGKLSRITRKELLQIRNLGRKSAEEIECVLKTKYGIVLEEE